MVYKNKISNLLSLEPVVDNHQLEPIIETKLKPGDLLYVPSRHYHCAMPKSPRISITIPCLNRAIMFVPLVLDGSGKYQEFIHLN